MNESQIINALWEAHCKGFSGPLRAAIHAARDNGMTDRQIAAELGASLGEVETIAREQHRNLASSAG